MAHLEWTDDAGHVIAVRFDSVRVVEHQMNAHVTRHPVQKGADISDHVRVDLPSISITGYVSKAPLNALSKIGERTDTIEAVGRYQSVQLAKSPATSTASALQGGIVSAGLSLFSGVTSPNSVESLVLDDLGSRVRLMTDLLTEALNSVRMIRVLDEARNYDDMVLTGEVVTRSNENFGGVFQLTLEQIKIVASKLTDLPVPREPRAAVAKAVGAVAAKTGNDNVDEKKRSAALAAAQSLFSGAFGSAAGISGSVL